MAVLRSENVASQRDMCTPACGLLGLHNQSSECPGCVNDAAHVLPVMYCSHLFSDLEWVYSLTGQMGSAMHMAPEVFLNQPYNEKVGDTDWC